MIEDVLRCLTRREREVFRLYHTDGLSIQKIAGLFDDSKNTIQTHFERANKKIEKKRMRAFSW